MMGGALADDVDSRNAMAAAVPLAVAPPHWRRVIATVNAHVN
jgi:hypothetical protein